MSLSRPTPRQAVAELVFAGGLWGFGFVATQWALVTWNPQGVLLWRFAGALVLGEILHLFFRSKDPQPRLWLHDFKLAVPAGLVLGSFLLVQTIGLQYTTASKSGFITTLYVIFVPTANFLLYKKKFPKVSLLFAVLACYGTYLLLNLSPGNLYAQVNQGDLWTLLAALLATFHIIYIGRITTKIKNPFRVNNFQSLWSLAVVVPMVLWNSTVQVGALNVKSLAGIFILAAACSVLAFFIQVRAQRVLSDSTASMLFLLESPFAFFFAYIFMDDRLSNVQAIGAGLIFISALGTVAFEPPASTHKMPAG
jgi:drug/metabolite transporter (DMT)-like permease